LEQRISTKLYDILRANLVPFIINFLQLPNVTETEILTIAGILDTNSFEMVLPSKRVRARGIFPETAMMAHECIPNTKHFVDENLEMRVIAAMDIEKGEKILTSYTHPLKTTIERRINLKQAKCFDCVCPRCSDATEMNTFSSCIKCHACDGLLTSVDGMENYKCAKCSQIVPVLKIIQIFNGIRAKLDELNKKSINDCEQFLKSYDYLLPEKSVFMVDVKYALCLLYGNTQGYMFEGEFD
jgi:hypothetical protein